MCVRDRLYGWHPAANRMLPQRKQEVTQPSNQRPRHLQETSAGVSTRFRLTADFLTDTSRLFLTSNNLLTFHLNRLVCSGTGDSTPPLGRPPVVPLGFFSEVWLLIFPWGSSHVRRRVRAFAEEEEVVCSELQAEHKDVRSGRKGIPVSLSSSCVFLPHNFTSFVTQWCFGTSSDIWIESQKWKEILFSNVSIVAPSRFWLQVRNSSSFTSVEEQKTLAVTRIWFTQLTWFRGRTWCKPVAKEAQVELFVLWAVYFYIFIS